MALPEKWASNYRDVIADWSIYRFSCSCCADGKRKKQDTHTTYKDSSVFIISWFLEDFTVLYRALFLERSKSSREKNTSGLLMSKVWHFIARSDPISWTPYLLSVTFEHLQNVMSESLSFSNTILDSQLWLSWHLTWPSEQHLPMQKLLDIPINLVLSIISYTLRSLLQLNKFKLLKSKYG